MALRRHIFRYKMFTFANYNFYFYNLFFTTATFIYFYKLSYYFQLFI